MRSEQEPASHQFLDLVVQQLLSEGDGVLSQAPILRVFDFLGFDPPPVVAQDSPTDYIMRAALLGGTCSSQLLQETQRRLSNRGLVLRAALLGSTNASLLLQETQRRLPNRSLILVAIRQFDRSDLLPGLDAELVAELTCDNGEFVCVVDAELQEWLDGAPDEGVNGSGGTFSNAHGAAAARYAAASAVQAALYASVMAASVSSRRCAFCGHLGRPKLKRCGGCRRARYCGVDCRNAHWSVHRQVCTPLQEGGGEEEEEKEKEEEEEEKSKDAAAGDPLQLEKEEEEGGGGR